MLQQRKVTSNPESIYGKASPILKWAGGKTQLLPTIEKHLPQKLLENKIDTYIEPFMGGGAVFFHLSNRFDFKEAYLFDINPELIILYNSIKEDVAAVISELGKLSDTYQGLNAEEQKEFFYKIRELYNSEVAVAHKAVNHSPFNAQRAAKTVFLNRTCFNGLFRVNSKGLFNVPFGRYKNPTILFEDKLRAASQALQKATIRLCDFGETNNYVKGQTFIYYDPPYRPVSKTSQFTSYSKESFGDAEQKRLAEMFKELNSEKTYQLLSNSDPCNYIEDPFFDDLYKEFEIERVNATRMINSNATKRGALKEILVRNY